MPDAPRAVTLHEWLDIYKRFAFVEREQFEAALPNTEPHLRNFYWSVWEKDAPAWLTHANDAEAAAVWALVTGDGR